MELREAIKEQVAVLETLLTVPDSYELKPGDPEYRPIQQIPVNVACLKALSAASFSPQQKRYMIEGSYQPQADLKQLNSILRHSFFDMLANCWNVVNNMAGRSEDEQCRLACQLAAALRYNSGVYATILGIDISKVETDNVEPTDFTFAQMLAYMDGVALQIIHRVDILNEDMVFDFDDGPFMQQASEGIVLGQAIAGFDFREWHALERSVDIVKQ